MDRCFVLINVQADGFLALFDLNILEGRIKPRFARL
jgi:hypothetical protein